MVSEVNTVFVCVLCNQVFLSNELGYSVT